jgi:hypothetical protein
MGIDYTKLIEQINPAPDGEDWTRLRVGTVVQLYQAGYADVAISGVTVPGVPVLAGVSVTTGAVVQILTHRGSMLVLGAVQTSLGATLYSENVNEVSTASTSFAAAASNNVGGFFQFPGSGRVEIHWGGELYADAAAGPVISIEIRTGTTVGSGTIVLGASDDYAARSFNQQREQFSTFYVWSGGTPNTAYNIRCLYRTTASTGRFSRRRILVRPLFV